MGRWRWRGIRHYSSSVIQGRISLFRFRHVNCDQQQPDCLYAAHRIPDKRFHSHRLAACKDRARGNQFPVLSTTPTCYRSHAALNLGGFFLYAAASRMVLALFSSSSLSLSDISGIMILLTPLRPSTLGSESVVPKSRLMSRSGSPIARRAAQSPRSWPTLRQCQKRWLQSLR